MLIAAFPAGPLQANCYVVATGPGAECVVVDPGMDAQESVGQVLREHRLRLAAVLLTHGHFDHVWDAAAVATEHGAPVYVHPADRHLLADPMAAMSGESAQLLRSQLELERAPELTEPSDVRDAVGTIEAAGLRLDVVHAPGHTPGTVMYGLDVDGEAEVSRVYLTGDFVFAGSIGRTDLVGGDHEAMTQSLVREILPLADDVVILPGHGPQSSIGRERATNPFLGDLPAAPDEARR